MWSYQETEHYLMQLVCDARIPVNYSDLYPRAGVNADDIGSRKHFHDLLGEISSDHYARGLPLLSVIVTTQNGMPGKGFFNLARVLNPDYVGVDDTKIFITEFGAIQANVEI